MFKRNRLTRSNHCSCKLIIKLNVQINSIHYTLVKLITGLIRSGLFSTDEDEEKMKKLGFATGAGVRINLLTVYGIFQEM